ncbi:MAG: CxxC-x17-CxxC domain-containing protein [Candidatus Nanoarchaeia archaeon]
MDEFNDRPEREMHQATCAECGQQCEVPFEPQEGKDVYCKECYRARRPARGGFRGGGRGGFENREMHQATCADCGQSCEVPFAPTPGKDVFCKECYRKKKGF